MTAGTRNLCSQVRCRRKGQRVIRPQLTFTAIMTQTLLLPQGLVTSNGGVHTEP